MGSRWLILVTLRNSTHHIFHLWVHQLQLLKVAGQITLRDSRRRPLRGCSADSTIFFVYLATHPTSLGIPGLRLDFIKVIIVEFVFTFSSIPSVWWGCILTLQFFFVLVEILNPLDDVIILYLADLLSFLNRLYVFFSANGTSSQLLCLNIIINSSHYFI